MSAVAARRGPRPCRRRPRHSLLTVEHLDGLPVGTVVAVDFGEVEVLYMATPDGFTVRPGQHATSRALSARPVDVLR